MKISLIASFIILLVGINFSHGETMKWEKEPQDFRGIPFGATETEAKNIIPTLDCRDAKSGRTCFDFPFKIGDAVAGCSLKFSEGKMNGVFIQIKPEDYNFIKSVFIEKFGNPMKSEDEIVKTKLGVEYNNQKLSWHGDNIIVILQKYCGSIRNGCGNYFQRSDIRKFAEEKEKAKKKGVKDF